MKSIYEHGEATADEEYLYERHLLLVHGLKK